MEPWSGQQVALELIRNFESEYRVKESKTVNGGIIGTIEHNGKFLWFRTCDMRTTGKIQVNTLTPGKRARYNTYGWANWTTPENFALKVMNLFLHGKWPRPMNEREIGDIDFTYSAVEKKYGELREPKYSSVRV